MASLTIRPKSESHAYVSSLILKKMKNKCIMATMLAMGLLIVSCTTDNEELNTSSLNPKNELNLKTKDSLSGNLPHPSTYASEDIVLPPRKP